MKVDERAHMNYQHPGYLKGNSRVRYRPELDYYSLGLILLEIGLWNQLGGLVESIRGTPGEMRDELLARIPRLGRYMGGIYCDIIKKCLIGGFEGLADAEKTDQFSLDTFLKIVVELLAQCVVQQSQLLQRITELTIGIPIPAIFKEHLFKKSFFDIDGQLYFHKKCDVCNPFFGYYTGSLTVS